MRRPPAQRRTWPAALISAAVGCSLLCATGRAIAGADSCDHAEVPVRRLGSLPRRSPGSPAPPPSRLLRSGPAVVEPLDAPDETPGTAFLPAIPNLAQRHQSAPVEASEETRRRVDRLKRQIEELGTRMTPPEVIEASPFVEPPVVEHGAAPLPDEAPFPDEVHEEQPASMDPPAEAVATQEVPPDHPQQPAHRDARRSPSTPAAESPHLHPKPVSRLPKNSTLIKDLPVAPHDRISVADNLFAAGETVLANEVYRQVPLQQVSRDDSGWVEFQIANCDRRLGKTDEARKRYRRLVADPTLAWQDVAKWWLDALDEQESLRKEHDRLKQVIQEVEDARNDGQQP